MVVLVPPERLERPPSLEDGVDSATEESLRIFGGELIQRAGWLLKLPQVTAASAAAIFQRFYFHKSLAEFEVRAVAAASVALASKLEENIRKLRDVIVVFYRLQMRELEDDDGAPEFAGKPVPALEIGGKEYEDLKKEVLRAERHILKELGFEVALFLDLPHRYVLRYVAALTKEGPSTLAQQAWNYLNDSLRTPLCCSHQPDVIAAAGVFLAARSLGVKLPSSSTSWWEALQVEFKEVLRVARVIQDLYRKPRARHILIPRKKKPKVVPEIAMPFAETPAPAMGSPDSDAGPEAAAEQPSAAEKNGHANGARQDATSSPDDARVAELLAGEPSGGAVADPDAVPGDAAGAVARQSSRTSGLESAPEAPPVEEEKRRGKKGKDKDKDKDKEKDRERERDKDKDRGKDRDRDRERKKDKEKEREKDKDRAKDRGREKQRKGRDKRSASRSGHSSSSPRKGRKRNADRAKEKDRRARRCSSSSPSAASSARSRSRSRRSRKSRTRSRSRNRRRPNARRHGVDEEDL